ncbi:TPA: hypothetical protein HA265_06810, partial [Candidatus Woesearchaeota archaeon]|nr:hypothetical protein [Candidatus Woesearchaeota archaeon]
GCTKQAPMHPEEEQKIAEEYRENLPTMPEAQPEPEPVPEPAPKPEAEAEPVPEQQPAPTKTTETDQEFESERLGSRVEGNAPAEEENPESVELPEGLENAVQVNLLPNKTMDQGAMTVKVGTEMRFHNADTWPHQIVVDSGSGFDTIRHWQGERMAAGGESSYVFNEPGVYTVRDIFSGSMRLILTVE